MFGTISPLLIDFYLNIRTLEEMSKTIDGYTSSHIPSIVQDEINKATSIFNQLEPKVLALFESKSELHAYLRLFHERHGDA